MPGTVKKSLIVLAVTSLCAMSLAATAPAQAPDAMAKLEMLSKELQLTPQQKGELLPILKTEVPKIEAIKKDSSLSGMQKLRQLHAIHEESAPQMQKILSPAQYQKLQAIRQQEVQAAIAKKRGGG